MQKSALQQQKWNFRMAFDMYNTAGETEGVLSLNGPENVYI